MYSQGCGGSSPFFGTKHLTVSLTLVDEVAAESRLSLMDTPHGYLQVRRLQMLTVVWMSIEVAVSIYAAVRAHSIALIGFGGDSVIELASATAVLARFASGGRFISERQASKTMAWLLFALAAFIATASIYSLFGDLKPQTSYLGMLLLLAAAVVMPWLAAQKRRLAAEIQSSSLRADAIQSSVCGYLAWIALAGLALNAAFGLWWADSVAALGLLPIVIKEGIEALRGDPCCCN
jgi:divalent metal cation (Fe/Co/Zn/Cd) transporter